MHPTTIEWTDLTSNPIKGTLGNWHCVRISEGCRNCYAATMNHRWGGPDFKKGADSLRLDDKELHHIRTAKQVGGMSVSGKRCFLGDMTDIFQDGVEPEWIGAIFDAMESRPEITFQILTKRPQNVIPLVSGKGRKWRRWPANVWLGVSAESQLAADLRFVSAIRAKAHLGVPVLFASFEPILSAIDLLNVRTPTGQRLSVLDGDLNWAICGGESGPGARPMHPEWARSLRDQCKKAGVPFFFKQWGAWSPVCDYYEDSDSRDDALAGAHRLHLASGCSWDVQDGQPPEGTWVFRRAGKKASGRNLDGREWNEFPGDGRQMTLRTACR